MNVALCTAYTRVGASEGFLESLHHFARDMAYDADYKGFFLEAGSDYGAQRNRATTRALYSGAEWMLHVDDDIRFPSGIADLLLEDAPSEAQVIVGVVPINHETPVNVYSHESGLALDPLIPQNGEEWAKIKGFGGAVHMVHREVYEKLALLIWPGCWYMHDQVLTEDRSAKIEIEPDLSFARRLIQADVQAWARYGLPLTHCKPVELSSGG